jgi:hypothetical protein
MMHSVSGMGYGVYASEQVCWTAGLQIDGAPFDMRLRRKLRMRKGS